jgi:hypothetical protein
VFRIHVRIHDQIIPICRDDYIYIWDVVDGLLFEHTWTKLGESRIGTSSCEANEAQEEESNHDKNDYIEKEDVKEERKDERKEKEEEKAQQQQQQHVGSHSQGQSLSSWSNDADKNNRDQDQVHHDEARGATGAGASMNTRFQSQWPSPVASRQLTDACHLFQELQRIWPAFDAWMVIALAEAGMKMSLERTAKPTRDMNGYRTSPKSAKQKAKRHACLCVDADAASKDNAVDENGNHPRPLSATKNSDDTTTSSGCNNVHETIWIDNDESTKERCLTSYYVSWISYFLFDPSWPQSSQLIDGVNEALSRCLRLTAHVHDVIPTQHHDGKDSLNETRHDVRIYVYIYDAAVT